MNASQPFVSFDGRYIMSYGEVYNYITLKDELSKQGYKFKSNSDSEVVYTLRRMGDGLPQKI